MLLKVFPRHHYIEVCICALISGVQVLLAGYAVVQGTLPHTSLLRWYQILTCVLRLQILLVDHGAVVQLRHAGLLVALEVHDLNTHTKEGGSTGPEVSKVAGRSAGGVKHA